MRAVRSTGAGVELVDTEEPTGPGALVHIRSASICGSDFGYIAGGSHHVLGHELAGVTDDGTAVAVEGAFGCGTCELCRRGATNLCPAMAESALGFSIDGGMAERFRAPEAHLVPVPPGVALADASILEPAAVAQHALVTAGVQSGMTVAVVGGGAIGLLAVAMAQAMGAEVSLEARHPQQVAAGERLGARPVEGPADVVVEAAGSPSALARSVELAAPGGSVAVTGVHTGPFELPFLSLFMREVRIVPSIAYARSERGRDMAEAAAALAARPEVADVLITHRFPLEDAVAAFETAEDRASGAIKVVVEVGS